MSVWMSDEAIDGGHDFISTLTRMDLVSDSSTPIDLSNTLANATMSGADYTKEDGSVNGRQVVVAAKPGILSTASGAALHVILSLSGVLHVITTCTSYDVVSGEYVNFPSWIANTSDPTLTA